MKNGLPFEGVPRGGLHVFFIVSYVLFIIAYNYVKRGSIE